MGKKKKPLRKDPAASRRPAAAPSAFITARNAARHIAGRLRALSAFAAARRTLLLCAALCGIIAVGIAFRVEDLGQWRQRPHLAFFNDEPLHTTFDAWFYLSLAQDLVDGAYAPIDERRGIPESPPRPSPPPLISVMAAALYKITPLSMNWIGALLPALVGPLLALPMYLVCRQFGGASAGLTAALLAVMYPFYVHRSNIGRFDTDCMILTLAMASVWACMRFAQVQSRLRYGYAGCGLAVYALFLWWWDQAPAVVTAFSVLPCLIALIFFYRPRFTEGCIVYGCLALGLIAVLGAAGFEYPLKIAESLWSKFLYISKDTSSLFPNIGLTISEQARPSPAMIVAYTTRNVPALLFALAGLGLLLVRRFSLALFLLPFLFLSVLAVTTANRFLIFLVPLLAAGTGQAVSELWNLRSRFASLYWITPLILVLLIAPLYRANADFVQWPKEPGYMVEAMDAARRRTPPDAVIWAWWDHGYALTYFARRATINDGSIHSGERTMYNAVPYAADSLRLAANFMCFYVERGLSGIRSLYFSSGTSRSESDELLMRILAAGPDAARALIAAADLAPRPGRATADEWLEFFFPASPRPLYFMVDNLLAKTASWWYWFGSWDIEAKDGVQPLYYPFYGITRSADLLSDSTGSLRIDTRSGTAAVNNAQFPLSHLVTRDAEGLQEVHYYNSSSYRFEQHAPTGYGALMDHAIAGSVFNRLFIRHEHGYPYFTPVLLKAPLYQLWEVRGDSPAP